MQNNRVGAVTVASKERPGVLVYFDIEPAVTMLDDAQRGRLFAAILSYAHYGVVPTFDDQLLEMAWSFIRCSIDRANEQYAATVHKKKLAGITSDFRRNYAPKNGINPDDEQALQEYISQRLSTGADHSTRNSKINLEETKPKVNQAVSKMKREQGGGEEPEPFDFEAQKRKRIEQLLAKPP